MDLASRRITEAIDRIDTFVEETLKGTATVSPEKFRELSCCIQLAKSARLERPSASPGSALAELSNRYRLSLERLQIRLQQIEMTLSAERSRLLAEHSRLARAREWQEQFTRTQ